MNTKVEKEIARFFQKRVRERMFYLLSSKKRSEIFDKIAHNADDYIDCSLIVQKDDMPLVRADIAKALGKECYAVCRFEGFDGRYVSINDALDGLCGCGEPFMLYGNNFLYLETEYDFSSHAAYLLKEDVKI